MRACAAAPMLSSYGIMVFSNGVDGRSYGQKLPVTRFHVGQA